MPVNVEIKARIDNVERVARLVSYLSDSIQERMGQEDTFFDVIFGRLKLRQHVCGPSELIYYERPDQLEPCKSHYCICPVRNPAITKQVLANALGVRGVIRKERLLYWIDNTRVHVDQVEGLGSFLELEVLLSPSVSASQGYEIAGRLIKKLGIKESNLVDAAYIDLVDCRTRE